MHLAPEAAKGPANGQEGIDHRFRGADFQLRSQGQTGDLFRHHLSEGKVALLVHQVGIGALQVGRYGVVDHGANAGLGQGFL